MNAGVRFAGQLVMCVGLSAAGFGLWKLSNSINDALPVISAATNQIGETRRELPQKAREAGHDAVIGAEQAAAETAVDPAGTGAAMVIKDKKAADAVSLAVDPIGHGLRKLIGG